jgi:hypothetical protein
MLEYVPEHRDECGRREAIEFPECHASSRRPVPDCARSVAARPAVEPALPGPRPDFGASVARAPPGLHAGFETIA